MQYGHFDNKSREYVIDRVDLPVSWTNYIGVGGMYGVFNHTAGGYLLYKTPEYHRITRFRPNGVPMDGPGHYIYIRDDDFRRLAKFWDDELSCLQISTPNEGMNTEINIWNLYQSEINVMFSRFTSFIEVGWRGGSAVRPTRRNIPRSRWT